MGGGQDTLYDVLIYGFGYTGKNVLFLCESLGCRCKVIDDGLNIELLNDARFLAFNQLNSYKFKLYLIAVSAKPNTIKAISDKLLAINIDSTLIKTISVDGFNEYYIPYFRMQFPSKDAFIKSILLDDEILTHFQNNYAKFKETHKKKTSSKEAKLLRQKIDKKDTDLNIFAKCYKYATKDIELGVFHYPGFYTFIDQNSPDQNFFFREKIDFERLSKRDESTKIIAILGPSTIYGHNLEINETLTYFLNDLVSSHKKDNFIILNLGISGFTIYEQLLLYNSLLFAIKPEIVISFFLSVELITAKMCCENLLKNHKIFYHTANELSTKQNYFSNIPLFHQLNEINHKISDENILEAICLRAQQFDTIVSNNDGKFYPIIIPILHCKEKWTAREAEGYKKLFQPLPKYYSCERENDPQLIKKFKKMYPKKLYDGNECITNSKKTLFQDWIHPTKGGNRIIAQWLFKILEENGEFD